jgi:hypothetical protein
VEGPGITPSHKRHAEPLPVLLSARLSSKKKGKYEGINIETQDKEARERLGRLREIRTIHGIYPGVHIIDMTADIKTGRLAPWDRKNLKPWVTRPDKMQQYAAIAATDNDRLSRGDPSDEWRIRQWAEDNGKVLIIVNGPQWPPRDDGDFWAWTAMAKQAATEWHQIRERSMRAQAELLERGKLCYGQPPWGYAVVGELYDKTLIPTALCRKWAPQIFQHRIDGDSLTQIADWLKAEGVPTKRKGQWTARSVLTLINNRIYAGMWTSASGTPLLAVEPVITADVWLRANEQSANTKGRPRGVSQGEQALLTSSLFCPMCCECPGEAHDDSEHAPMYRSIKDQYIYYRCAGRYPERKGCGNYVNLEATDQGAVMLLSISKAPWTELRLVRGVNHQAELSQIKLDIRDLGAQDLPDDEYDRRLTELRARRDDLLTKDNIPDQWKEEDTGLTVGQHFLSLDRAGQRQMILDEVKFYAKPAGLPGKDKRIPVVAMKSRLFTVPAPLVQAEAPGEAA